MTAPTIRCQMPTTNLRLCSRPARFAYYQGETLVNAYCAQHDRARGHSAMLRPRVWEYGCKVDLAAHIHVEVSRAAVACYSRHGGAR